MNGLKVEKPLRLLCEFLGERRADCEADGLQIGGTFSRSQRPTGYGAINCTLFQIRPESRRGVSVPILQAGSLCGPMP